jgi:dGTP triphosphohydrolase
MELTQIMTSLKLLFEKHHLEKENLYERLLHICHYISLLTDGNALELYEMINGRRIISISHRKVNPIKFIVKVGYK